MRICRFDDDRVGVVCDEKVYDVTPVLQLLPPLHWPVPPGDLFIANLQRLAPHMDALAKAVGGKPVSTVTLKSPVANPTKIINAPYNYGKLGQPHVAGSEASVKSITSAGLFLKATTALVGPGEGIALRSLDRCTDHEIEMAVVIGQTGTSIPRSEAGRFIAGYAIGLDMTIRGAEFPSFRKSVDSYAVLGPWLVTADEVSDPNSVDFELSVNGKTRQKSNTRHLIYDVARLIEYASSLFTLYPGDLIFSGTPDGIGPVKPGDVMTCRMQGVGDMQVAVRAA